MSFKGIHRGFLRKYGGFVFKQWKERYLVLTAEGNLLVCRDADSPPDQVVSLQKDCEVIAEGREILDLPRLPLGGRRDCCLAVIMTQDKFLLLLAENANDCSQWLHMLRKVRESVSSPAYPWKRQKSPTPCITDRDPFPEPTDKEPVASKISDVGPPALLLNDQDNPASRNTFNRAKAKMSQRPVRSGTLGLPQRSPDCLRHGNSSDARAVRAVCLLMGGAAATSALGYLGTISPTPHTTNTADLTAAGDLSGLGSAGAHHTCSQAADTPNFHSFDFEGDSDFDAFDCGGFAF
ncbi:uncharacterized protein LOC108941579 isoform X2 [Scleropages formosus]|uniref:uncharacterized protein LOC108941579 isoform X2 n=1 Tax=Scleropages formosus TaxID=113540 RepID=UPI0008781811|nr:uncharacterized protein LOC108941579 isoform X2 [Scleropages formosus]